MTDTPTQIPPISNRTPMTLATVGSIVVAVAAAASWAAGVNNRLTNIEEAVRMGVDDRWKGHHMRVWVSTFDQNLRVWQDQMRRQLDLDVPSLQAPDPDMIRGVK